MDQNRNFKKVRD